MKHQFKHYIKLVVWIISLIMMGFIIGSLAKKNVNTWYLTLNKSFLTPPSYIFSITWSFLYTTIAIAGWYIWESPHQGKLKIIKMLYTLQLIFNWLWTPLFFIFHQIGSSLVCLLLIIIFVTNLIIKTYKKLNTVSFLLIPYLLWLIFAAYLNFYIWQYN